MSNYRGVKTINDGCIFAIDGLNYKSYNSGSTDVYNLLNTSHSGSLLNGTGYSNGTFTFDGTDDYIEVPNIGIKDLDYFTIEFWVKIKPGAYTNHYFMGIHNGSGNGVDFSVRDDGATPVIRFIFDTDLQSYTIKSFTYEDDTWYHGCTTWDSGSFRAFVNGEELGSPSVKTGTPSVNSDILRIGLSIVGFTTPQSEIPYVKVYNRTLTPQEVSTNYNSLKGRVQ